MEFSFKLEWPEEIIAVVSYYVMINKIYNFNNMALGFDKLNLNEKTKDSFII